MASLLSFAGFCIGPFSLPFRHRERRLPVFFAVTGCRPRLELSFPRHLVPICTDSAISLTKTAIKVRSATLPRIQLETSSADGGVGRVRPMAKEPERRTHNAHFSAHRGQEQRVPSRHHG